MTPLPRDLLDVTCTACGCLCDDIAIQKSGDGWRADNACSRGDAWFRDAAGGPPVEALIGGRSASLNDALAEAGRVLAAARWPLIFGLADLDVNGQRAAAALADELGACLDNSAPATADDALFPGIGDAGCTWGEVRDRADLIIYWNCDPAQTHPRHNELILRPACQARKPRVLHIRAADTLSAAWTIRMVLKRGTTDDAWREFVDAVQCSRYGVIVHDHTTPRIALRALATDLNRRSRFRRIDLGRPGNAAGECAVIRWQSGYSRGVGFHHGCPVSYGTEFMADSLLARDAVDVVVSAGGTDGLSPPARRTLTSLPNIAIVSHSSKAAATATIALFAKTSGIHAGGSVFRSDGLVLPLRAVFPSSIPSADMVIKRLAEVVRKQRATKDG